MALKIPEHEFLDAFKRLGSPQKVADFFQMSLRNVYRRRNHLENKLGVVLSSFENDRTHRNRVELPRMGIRQIANVTGPVVVFGDAHWWPGQAKTVAHRALLEVIREIRPALIVANGDLLDLPSSSRHAPLGYGEQPTHDVAQEIAVCQEYLAEIEMLAPANCILAYNLGNHDVRLAARISQWAPEIATLHGTRLEDHLPAWSVAMSLLVNGNMMIKHRPPKGGIHATHGSIVASGLDCIVTNHLHALRISPLTTYRPRRAYGVDAGCLADPGPQTPQFTYLEDAPAGWASGFAILHVEQNGTILPPELCEVVQGRAYWRGQAVV